MQGIRRDRPAAAAAAAGGGELGALELIPPQDRRLPRAAVCFLALGFCMLIHSTGLNYHSAANQELVFAGFFVFIVGAALALFTLGGAGAGHADARVE
ncbi:hypothetical protein SETIT_4G264300v2 [Setaria italica]|uniref:Uncharacterized protein n=1 Tax=Setaria italica TaxID=4555 RepID=A0A368QYL7_SETIT|nr:hypothetical protein SETIT_4G264300v2 [Setaria italica]